MRNSRANHVSSSDLVKTARVASELTQRELASRAGVPQPRVAEIEADHFHASFTRVEKLAHSAGTRLSLLPSVAPAVWEVASNIRRELEVSQEDVAWREIVQLSDTLVSVEPALRVALCVMEPASVGDKRYDALIAAVVDYRLGVNRLPLPPWVRMKHRILTTPWDVETSEQLRNRARRATPNRIALHGIYLDARELESV